MTKLKRLGIVGLAEWVCSRSNSVSRDCGMYYLVDVRYALRAAPIRHSAVYYATKRHFPADRAILRWGCPLT